MKKLTILACFTLAACLLRAQDAPAPASSLSFDLQAGPAVFPKKDYKAAFKPGFAVDAKLYKPLHANVQVFGNLGVTSLPFDKTGWTPEQEARNKRPNNNIVRLAAGLEEGIFTKKIHLAVAPYIGLALPTKVKNTYQDDDFRSEESTKFKPGLLYGISLVNRFWLNEGLALSVTAHYHGARYTGETTSRAWFNSVPQSEIVEEGGVKFAAWQVSVGVSKPLR